MDRDGDCTPAGPEPTVLVVDDNVDNQELLAYLLKCIGYRTEVAGNGLQAIAAFTPTAYAAVFMDCEMPQMDGFQAAAELRRMEPPGRRTPIIAITAHPSQDVRARCLAAGMDDCLTKPVRAEDLQAAITAATREVDLVALAGLAEQIGTDALGAVLESFQRETNTRLARLYEAVTSGDRNEVSRVAHAIKGGAMSLGASRVAELSSDLQRLADAGSLVGAADLTAALEEAFARALTASTQLLESIRRSAGGSSPDGPPNAAIPHQPGTRAPASVD